MSGWPWSHNTSWVEVHSVFVQFSAHADVAAATERSFLSVLVEAQRSKSSHIITFQVSACTLLANILLAKTSLKAKANILCCGGREGKWWILGNESLQNRSVLLAASISILTVSSWTGEIVRDHWFPCETNLEDFIFHWASVYPHSVKGGWFEFAGICVSSYTVFHIPRMIWIFFSPQCTITLINGPVLWEINGVIIMVTYSGFARSFSKWSYPPFQLMTFGSKIGSRLKIEPMDHDSLLLDLQHLLSAHPLWIFICYVYQIIPALVSQLSHF